MNLYLFNGDKFDSWLKFNKKKQFDFATNTSLLRDFFYYIYIKNPPLDWPLIIAL